MNGLVGSTGMSTYDTLDATYGAPSLSGGYAASNEGYNAPQTYNAPQSYNAPSSGYGNGQRVDFGISPGNQVEVKLD